ncbi:MAG: BamA/TamA family outer membrane protein [Acidobacteria bacterium]|nr:BamA/TamA family outer membrane protein [Acidobacteriota bacterium]
MSPLLSVSPSLLPSFSPSLFLSFALSLLLAVSVSAQSLETYLGKNVAEVRITYEGAAARLGTDDLRGLVRVREGNPYSAVEVRRSLLALFESGRVANARAEARINNTGTVVVSFLITPQLRVGDVNFTGLVPEITVEELRAKLSELDRGLKYSEVNLNRGGDLLAETFRDRGYYQAAIEPKIKLDETGTIVDITYNVTPGASAKIAALNLTGNSKLPEATLRLALKSKVGETFVRSAMNADTQQLLQMHLQKNYFAAKVGPADISYDSTKNTVSVNLPISSGPASTIKVEGAVVTEKKLRQILPLMREGGVDEASLDDSARRIREHLQEEGYFFAEVTPPPMPDLNSERADLTFQVEPGQRYRVTDIRVEGTNNISLLELEPNLQTQKAALFPIPILTTRYTRGITSEQALRRDAELILSQLRDQGYRRARMAAINRAVSEDNDQLKIIFRVVEGPRSHIGDIAFRGNTLFTSDKLRGKVTINNGEPFSISRIKIEANEVLQQYYDEGYATASVIARTYEMGSEQMRVIYEVTEGPRVFINRIFINEVGLRRRTIGGRVRNYLRFDEGDILKNDDLSRSEQDLYGSGAFRRVQIRMETLGEETSTGEVKRNVFVDVEEGKSRTLVYGAGYQSDEGPRGIFEISDPNILGRLTTASLRLRASPRNLLGQLSYTDPRPFNYSTPLLFSLLVQQQKRPAFDATRFTGLLQVEKQLGQRSLLLFRYNYDAVNVRPPSTGSSPALDLNDPLLQLDRRDRPIRLSRLSGSFAYDGRDNPFDATKGRYHTADATIALRSLGGNGQFFRFFTENQAYRTLPSKFGSGVIATNLRLGLSANIGTPVDKILPPNPTDRDRKLIPITERFFSGGSTTLRGYNFELAGPRNCLQVVPDPNDATKKIVKDCQNAPTAAGSNPIFQLVGGNALVILNAELRQPVYRQISLVGFYDMGNVFLKIDDLAPKNFTHSVGLGIRVKTPLGPLRLDLGYLASDPYNGTGLNRNFHPDYNAPRVRWHISFGQAF